jgi:hypothetical protein
MVYFGRPNCEHLDNYFRCKVHRGGFLTRWLSPPGGGIGRPPCIVDRNQNMEPQDGELTCPDQKERPRPPPPRSQSGVMAPRTMARKTKA